ncbi:hypothetical protein ABB07_36945 [Streptomyces incarnatus]|uniref:Secreted protein n=1 Tax=Streptomyces incarnatus TaxID=665007 RepID=A0ABN4GUL1_9ACTN|nr:hypothetical protein [Streptomyces incarnatus]AKJ15453.1 hypothetical protein ABB07_36945 [Streptomyces incarnatus]
MHSTRMTTAAGLLGAAAFCLAGSAQAFAHTGVHLDTTSYCGTDRATGLAVSATKDVPCATALRVAAAYTKVWHGTEGAPIEVRAAGATWKCQEHQGDPDPYRQCATTQDGKRLVTLSS